MNDQELNCADESRRDIVREKKLNGLDYLNVDDDGTTLIVYFLDKLPSEFTNRAKKKEVLAKLGIEGGEHITGIKVLDFEPHRASADDIDDYLKISLDQEGDFSAYTLRLIGFEKIDPRYAALSFRFHIDCPSDLDCKQETECPPIEYEYPEIDYMAKDYASFRQLMLNRLSLIMPDWKERHVPDIGITLLEILAYTGDHLSYYQDAVGTEAYLGTARQRISVRRHARLVDYILHEGCNARAWVYLNVSVDFTLAPESFFFITAISGTNSAAEKMLPEATLDNIETFRYEVFEPLIENGKVEYAFYTAHNEIQFYTWGNAECCLPQGTTHVTLMGKLFVQEEAPIDDDDENNQPPQAQNPKVAQKDDVKQDEANHPYPILHLEEGDVLIFEEVLGPKTGVPADADPRHRHAVRITKLDSGTDPLTDQPIVEIEWGVEDALPFSVCISAIGAAPDCILIENISVARGNVVLTDQGRRVPYEDLGRVPTKEIVEDCVEVGFTADERHLAGKFQPHLEKPSLVFSQPLQTGDSASSLMKQNPRKALPSVQLISTPPLSDEVASLLTVADMKNLFMLASRLRKKQDAELDSLAVYFRSVLSLKTLHLLDKDWDGESVPPFALRKALVEELFDGWMPQVDLMNSGGYSSHFVVEIDNEGYSHLRFGDGELGRQPEAGMKFFANYRVGGGTAGNVGADAIKSLVLHEGTSLNGVTINELRNPLPAVGGVNPESLVDAKLLAPATFRAESQIQRAITADDYALIAGRYPGVQRAAAALRWTGSWYEVMVVIDLIGGQVADEALLKAVEGYLYPFRRIGHDLVVKAATYVPVEVELDICILPGYRAGQVKAVLLHVLGNGMISNRERAFFHPDNLTFGQGIPLSTLIAIAQSVKGVQSVEVTKLNRGSRFNPSSSAIPQDGILQFNLLEIPRMDNDPSFPDNGKLILNLKGGL